jgi:hypothetical protein
MPKWGLNGWVKTTIRKSSPSRRSTGYFMEEKSEQPDLRAEKRAGAMASGRECSPKQACRKETGGYARGCRSTDLIYLEKAFWYCESLKPPMGRCFLLENPARAYVHFHSYHRPVSSKSVRSMPPAVFYSMAKALHPSRVTIHLPRLEGHDTCTLPREENDRRANHSTLLSSWFKSRPRSLDQATPSLVCHWESPGICGRDQNYCLLPFWAEALLG